MFMSVHRRACPCTRCMCEEAGRHADWQSEEDFLSVAQWEANPPPVSPSLRLSARPLSLSVSDRSHLFRRGALSAGLSWENQQAPHSLLSSAKRQVGDWVFSGLFRFALFWIALASLPKNLQNWPVRQLWLRACVCMLLDFLQQDAFRKPFEEYPTHDFHMIRKGKSSNRNICISVLQQRWINLVSTCFAKEHWKLSTRAAASPDLPCWIYF